MKTGMEYPLIGLVALVILVIIWNVWSGMQVDLSVAALNATIAGTEAPAPVIIAGGWLVKALVSLVLGGVVTAGITTLFVWARKKWRQQASEQRQWKSGPNAYWGQPRQPKVMSEAELYRLMLMQQMTGGTATPARNVRLITENDDEPTITL